MNRLSKDKGGGSIGGRSQSGVLKKTVLEGWVLL